MPGSAVFSLFCSMLLGAPANAATVQEHAQASAQQPTATAQKAVIPGPIPATIVVRKDPAATTFTAAIAGTVGVHTGGPSLVQNVLSATQSIGDQIANGTDFSTITNAAEAAAVDSPVTTASDYVTEQTVTAELLPPSQTAGATVYAYEEQPVLAYTNIPVQFLNPQQPVDRIAGVISSNEGKPTTIDWNDNGKGVSVGLFQANQRVGELPSLLNELSSIPDGHQQIIEAFGPTIAEKVKADPEVVRRLPFSPKNDLGKGLKKLVHSSLFQKLQVAILRRKVNQAAEIAAQYGIHSEAGVAVCADLTNQWGRGGAARFLKAAHSMRSEGGKIKAIVNAVKSASPYGSRYIGDLTKVVRNDLSYDEAFVPNTTSQPDTVAEAMNVQLN